MYKNVTILGGYGNTGRQIAQLLLKHTDLKVTLAGRDIDRANQFANVLNYEHNIHEVKGTYADASNIESLNLLFRDADLVINASSTIEYTDNVAKAAVRNNCSYIDIQLSSKLKSLTLKSYEEKILKNKSVFITDGGFHPGIPAALIRYAAGKFDELSKANVGSIFRIDWKNLELSDSTTEELLEEFRNYDTSAFIEGNWKALKWNDYKSFRFQPPFGEQKCIPMMMDELRDLPKMIPSLREIGFYVAGFNPVVDYFISPLVIIMLKFFPSSSLHYMARLFEWGLKTFTKPPFRTELIMEAKGKISGDHKKMTLRLFHDDAYFLTAAPVVACVLQLLKGNINPGLYLQAHIVEPVKFLDDLKVLGVNITEELS